MTKLIMVSKGVWIKDEKQRMYNYVFNNLVWICTHTIVLTGLIIAANYYPDTVYNWRDLLWQDESTNNTSLPLTNTTWASINANTFNGTTDEPSSIGDQVLHSFFDGYQLSSRALVQNRPLLNGLYVSVLVAIALHASLFYWHMWKPFKNNKDAEEENELKEREDVEEMTTVSSRL